MRVINFRDAAAAIASKVLFARRPRSDKISFIKSGKPLKTTRYYRPRCLFHLFEGSSPRCSFFFYFSTPSPFNPLLARLMKFEGDRACNYQLSRAAACLTLNSLTDEFVIIRKSGSRGLCVDPIYFSPFGWPFVHFLLTFWLQFELAGQVRGERVPFRVYFFKGSGKKGGAIWWAVGTVFATVLFVR